MAGSVLVASAALAKEWLINPSEGSDQSPIATGSEYGPTSSSSSFSVPFVFDTSTVVDAFPPLQFTLPAFDFSPASLEADADAALNWLGGNSSNNTSLLLPEKEEAMTSETPDNSGSHSFTPMTSGFYATLPNFGVFPVGGSNPVNNPTFVVTQQVPEPDSGTLILIGVVLLLTTLRSKSRPL